MSQFKIKTNTFEGPLDLLLTLVEKRKFFINDISLSQITDDFLSYIKSAGENSLREVSDFLLIASTLVLIKSRSLLPLLSLTAEEEGNIEELKARLKIYQRVKELSHHISAFFGNRVIFSRGDQKNITVVFSPGKDVTIKNIFLSAQDILLALPKKDVMPAHSVKKAITLEEMILKMIERIKRHMKMSFHDFSGKTGNERGDRTNIIVSFLALLELVKRGVIAATQNERFEDIEIETREVGVPKY